MYNNAYTPPVNNLLQPDIYNRLDAETIERTRVVNTQLDERLREQERIIAKYRLAAERLHRREKARVKEELTRISTKLPAACRIKDFRSKFLYGVRRNSMPASLQSVSTKIRGVPEEKVDLPFCERYFIHHLPTKKKYYKRRTPTPPLHGVRPVEGQTVPVGESGGTVTLPPLDASASLVSGNVGVSDSDHSVDAHGVVSRVADSGVGSSVNSQQSHLLDPVVEVDSQGERSRTGRGDSPHRKSPRRDRGQKTSLPPIDESSKTYRKSPQLLKG